jgi:hypothetical protein
MALLGPISKEPILPPSGGTICMWRKRKCRLSLTPDESAPAAAARRGDMPYVLLGDRP